MARPLRIEYPGAWYHVTCRGNERRAIFRDDRDRERFLETVDETRELFGVEVHGYVLMDNHVHLILMTPGGTLQKFMQRLNTSYTVFFNRRHRRSGHLFQGRYQAVLGSEEFVERVFERFLAKRKVVTKEFPGFREFERGPETVEEIGRRVAGLFQVAESELRRRRSRHGGARSVFMELCRLCLAEEESCRDRPGARRGERIGPEPEPSETCDQDEERAAPAGAL